MKFEESIVIKTPAKDVFKYLSNFRGHKKFALNYKVTQHLGKGTITLGSELNTSMIYLGQKLDTKSAVTVFTPNTQITYESHDTPVPSRVDYLLEEKGNSTQVTLRYELEPGSYFRMEEMFLRPRIGDHVKASMVKLKTLIETKFKQ